MNIKSKFRAIKRTKIGNPFTEKEVLKLNSIIPKKNEQEENYHQEYRHKILAFQIKFIKQLFRFSEIFKGFLITFG